MTVKAMKTASILRPAPSPATPANRLGRKPLGLWPHVSRKLLAEAVGTASETVVRVLNGSVDPTLALAQRMAAALGMTMERFTAGLDGVRRARGVKGGRRQVQSSGRSKFKSKRKTKGRAK